jgi:serine protease Do
MIMKVLRATILGASAFSFSVATLAQQPAPAQQAAPMQAPVPMVQLPSVADLAEKLLPAVVEISVQGKVAGAAPVNPVPDVPENSPFKDFFDDFLKRHQGQGGSPGRPAQPVTSMGSGFVIESSGLIVTNNHVIEDADEIEVHFQDNTRLKAELVGRDPKTDLAVLRVKSDKPLPVVPLGDSDTARIGEWAIAIGNPFGLGGSVSLGIISARGRDINSGPYDDFIQTDAAINKGNSGGPLFNLKGEVIGVNTAILSSTGGSVGIGFAVPANLVRNIVAQLEKFGEVRRGWLGVKIQSVTDDIAESMAMGKARGALIADVVKGGPGEKAGMKAGDVVIEFNGKPVNEVKDLPRLVADSQVGGKATMKVLRSGKETSLNVEVGLLEDDQAKAVQVSQTPEKDVPSVSTVLGMTISSVTDELRLKYKVEDTVKGAVVTAVAADSTAADKRLEPGDVITEAGDKQVQTAADVAKAVEDAEKIGKTSVLLLVSKGGKQSEMRFIALKLKK